MIDCGNVSYLKKQVTLWILVFTFFPLIIGIFVDLLGSLGIISNEAVYVFEFAVGYISFTTPIGLIASLIATTYFSKAEKRCGIVSKLSLLNVLIGVSFGGGLLIFIVLMLVVSSI
jgi:hypothetical protein